MKTMGKVLERKFWCSTSAQLHVFIFLIPHERCFDSSPRCLTCDKVVCHILKYCAKYGPKDFFIANTNVLRSDFKVYIGH